MGAVTILAVGFLALTLSASTGARLLAEGRQRQSATEIANRQLEHFRNIPYDQVGLSANLNHVPDTTHPDYYVSLDGTRFDWKGTGAYEDLVVESDGQIIHSEDLTVGATELTTYHYVTWVDDPDVTGTRDYKRLTVAVYYRAPVNTGRPRVVRASTLFTTGTVTVGGTGTSPNQGSVPVPSSSPPPPPSGSCSGDTSGPTGDFTILSGTGTEQGYTASQTVTIQVSPSDACTPITFAFSNDGVTYGDKNTYVATNPTATWQVTSGDGTKSIRVRFYDGLQNARTIGPKTVVLDQTLPTKPGTLSRTVSCAGNNRTVSLSWGVSSDANLVGYRVYRSIDSEPWEMVKVTASLNTTDTHAKNLDSVRFRVVGYDKAGNESVPTNEIALAKNQCS